MTAVRRFKAPPGVDGVSFGGDHVNAVDATVDGEVVRVLEVTHDQAGACQRLGYEELPPAAGDAPHDQA